jgi:ribosomal-protein-alanine N-acetyltransferase
VQYNGKDLYYALLVDGEMVGYGILRGWDEGYEVPSLGIAVDPASQGRGYGRLLIEFLHGTARQRGAKRIRLKVYAHNLRALALYKSLGYVFQGEEGDQRVAYLDL